MQKDPHELHSVYGEAEYVATRQELSTELARLRTELKVPSPDPPESLMGPGRAAGGRKKWGYTARRPIWVRGSPGGPGRTRTHAKVCVAFGDGLPETGRP